MAAITANYEREGPSFFSALWLTGVLLRVFAGGVVFGLSFYQPIALPILAAFFAADLFGYIWALVRFSNAAGYHLGATGRFWPVVGGYSIFLLGSLAMAVAWWLVFTEADTTLRMQEDKSKSQARAAPPPDRFVTEFSRDRRQLIFRGVVSQGADLGIAADIEESDRLDTLVLNSPGGNVREARLMAQTVSRNGLATHVTNECSASCILVFMAGRPRTIGPGAKLGFHRYGLDFMQVLPHLNPLREMRTDQQFFLEQGADLDFLDKVFDLNRETIWYPKQSELLSAGVIDQ